MPLFRFSIDLDLNFLSWLLVILPSTKHVESINRNKLKENGASICSYYTHKFFSQTLIHI
jgi:hypothetical protein